jgi:hypothetical protein
MDAQMKLIAYVVYSIMNLLLTKLYLSNANAKLTNPLRGIPRDELMRDVDTFAEEKGIVSGTQFETNADASHRRSTT